MIIGISVLNCSARFMVSINSFAAAVDSGDGDWARAGASQKQDSGEQARHPEKAIRS